VCVGVCGWEEVKVMAIVAWIRSPSPCNQALDLGFSPSRCG
jgi:hypothetical protein